MSERIETVLNVDGMTCGSCVRHVEAALKELDGVGAVEVKLQEKMVRVEHDADKVPVARIIEAITEEGYEARDSAR